MIYHCCDALRRNAVAAHPTLNGIDYLEVLDNDAPAGSPRQRTLFLRLLKPVPAGFAAEQVRIEGGERRRAGLFRRFAVARPCAGDPHGSLRRLLALSAEPRALGARYHPAPGLRPPAVGGELLLQGRMSQRLRLQARRGLSRRARRRTGHRLPRQGLSDLPAPDPEPHHPAGAGLDRPQPGGCRRDPGRAHRLCRRPALLSAGRNRDRSLSLDGAAAPIAAPSCPAGRLSPPRRLQRPQLDPSAGRCRWRGAAAGRHPVLQPADGRGAAHRPRHAGRSGGAAPQPDGLRAAP